MERKTVFRYILQSNKCKSEDYGFDRQQEVAFVNVSRSYIKHLVLHVMDLLKKNAVNDVANHLGMG